jgi:hypothetical protein
MMLGFFRLSWFRGVGGKHMGGSKRFLLASVSSAALVLSASAVIAADLAPVRKRDVPHTWTFWLEGGAQGVAGIDPAVAGFTPGFVTPKRTWGWNGALGFDYRIDEVWHASGSFRYGQNRTRSGAASTPQAVFNLGPTFYPTSVVGIVGANTATRHETNWTADFMVGRDIGIGTNNPQVKVGLRVADIRGKTEGTAAWLVPSTIPTPNNNTHSYQQINHFLGFGPRLAIEGSFPAGGGWFFDYMGGVAGLYSINRSVEQTVVVTATNSNPGFIPFPALCLVGCPVSATSEVGGFLLNADAMLGVGYAFTPYAKLSVNYRVDAYFNAMRTFDANGNVVNVNRVYHGPNVRLTLTY